MLPSSAKFKLWAPPRHGAFVNTSTKFAATPITNTIFGAFFLALDRLQQLLVEDGTGAVAMADPAVVECVLRHWTLGDSRVLCRVALQR